MILLGAEVRSSTSSRLAVTGEAPGVVVAQGFAGSARLMRPFADTLARRGFVVMPFDFAGHGPKYLRLRWDEVDVAVRRLRCAA